MKRNLIGTATIFVSLLALSVAAIGATVNPHSKATKRILQDNYGGSMQSNGSVEQLQNPGKKLDFISKEMWVDLPSTSLTGSGEWLEIGGVKGGVDNSITNPTSIVYWEGHFFAYSLYKADGTLVYREGKIGAANPTGSHKYTIQRDFASSNTTRWVALLDDVPAYYLTTNIVTGTATKFSKAAAVTFGIESGETTNTFTNGTTVDSLSLIPSSGNPTNAWLLYQGTSMVDLDTPLTSPNNYNGMRSTFFPYDGVNNSITFNHN